MNGWDALRRPIWLFDPVDLRGLYANPAALQLWGARSLQELLQRDFTDLSPAVRARTARLVEATAAGAAVRERWTFYPNGRPATVDATISAHRLDDGRTALLFEASPAEVDPEERRAVEALRHTTTLVTLFDARGTPLFANPAAFSTYGAQGGDFVERFADRSAAHVLFDAALADGQGGEVAEMVTLAGVRHHFLKTRSVLDPVSGEPGVLLNEVDVTLRVEAERARAAAEQRAAMAEARQAFLMEMSHELRTPLNAVIGFSNLLRRDALTADQIEQADRIHAAGLRLAVLADEMIGLGAAPGAPTGSRSRDPGGAEEWLEARPGTQDGHGPLGVLYVDDNDSNRALVKAVLASQGIACALAEDGREGVAAAREGGFDVILMDIQMPVMNGIEATRAIRALAGRAARTPILAVSANTQTEELSAYAAAGMDDVIAKPINAVELLGKVAGWGAAGREDAEAA